MGFWIRHTNVNNDTRDTMYLSMQLGPDTSDEVSDVNISPVCHFDINMLY